jgi:hypothetical protein
MKIQKYLYTYEICQKLSSQVIQSSSLTYKKILFYFISDFYSYRSQRNQYIGKCNKTREISSFLFLFQLKEFQRNEMVVMEKESSHII